MNILRLQLEAMSHFSYADPYLLSEEVAAGLLPFILTILFCYHSF